MYLRAARFIAFVALLVQPAAAWAQSETVEYYGLDAIGSVRIVFDPSGNVLARLDYEPFGRQVSPSPNATDRKFAGLFRDGEAGLDYAEARSYQVRTGRFSRPDPVYEGLFEPQRWNRYGYAFNNPLTYTDPTGLQAQNCTFTDVKTDTGYSVGVTCSDQGGGGGGNGIGDMLAWLALSTIDRITGAEGAGAPALDGQYHSRQYTPSWGEELLASAVAVAAAITLPGGKTGLTNAAKSVAGQAAKAATAPRRFLTGVKVTDKKTGKVFEGTVDLKPTLDRINSGQPFPHKNDGGVFENRPPLGSTTPGLPPQSPNYYREYVHPTPGVPHAGPQRIVVGQGGEMYYTPDHYYTFIPLNRR